MKKQSGFTLVELMIAGIIGVFIISGLLNFFIATNKSVTLSDSISKNQEIGRFSMEYLTKFIRRAGYSEISSTFTPPVYIAFGSSNIGPAIDCSGNQALACSSNNPPTPSTTALNPGSAFGDRVSIPYTVTKDDVSTTTCSGVDITGTIANPRYLVDVFWVSAHTDNLRELRCNTFDRDANNWLGGNAAGVPIMNNIEQMEFLVGINDDQDGKSATRYVNIDTIITSPTLSVLNIRSIRVAILTTSTDDLEPNVLQSNTDEREYILLDAPTIRFNDSSLRNIFMTTIEFPNMIETSGT